MRVSYLLWLDQFHKNFSAGVTQVSPLKALIFNLYLVFFNNLICQCWPKFHLYADDRQIDVIKLALNIPSHLCCLHAKLITRFGHLEILYNLMPQKYMMPRGERHSFLNLPLWAHYKEFGNTEDQELDLIALKSYVSFLYITMASV